MFFRKLYIGIAVLTVMSLSTRAQELKLTGKVLDFDNNQPLPFANLIIENTNYTSTTNDNGIFHFYIKEKVEYPLTIIASYIGYEKQKQIITNHQQDIIISLHPSSLELSEISVFAKRIFIASKDNISTNSMAGNQVRNLAGMTKDAFRSIQLLPGVSSNNETSSKYNVRGGNYDENLVLINGIEIYSPFHLKQAPMASVGIFNIDMVKSISFSAGGYNAEYGNALSSLLNIEYEPGEHQYFSGKFDFNFLDMALLAKGNIDNKLGYNIGIRKSNLNYLIKAGNVKPDIDIIYYDYQAQFDFKFNDNNKLKVNLIYSGDDYDQKPFVEVFRNNSYRLVKGEVDLVSSAFYRNQPFNAYYRNFLLGVVSENKLSSRFTSKIYFSFYNEIENENLTYDDETRYTFKNNTNLYEKLFAKGNRRTELITNTISFKHDLTVKVTPNFSLKSGYNYKSIGHDYNTMMHLNKEMVSNVAKYPTVSSTFLNPDPSSNDTSLIKLNTYRFESYIQGSFRLFDVITINNGIRLDYFELNKQAKVSPRFSLLYKGPWDINYRIAWGVFYQPPSFIQYRLYESSVDNSGYQKATHYIAGIDKNFSDNINLSIEYYYKEYDNYIPAVKETNGRISFGEKLNNAAGFAKGIDLQLMLNFDRFYFWGSYGYLIAREKIIGSNEGYYPRFTDQTHTLSAVLGVDLGSNWNVTLKGFYGSGYAFTPSKIVIDQATNSIKWIKGDKNSAYYPAYERADLTITKTINLFGNPLDLYFDIMNITNKRNILSLEYSLDSNGDSLVKENKLFTIVPMVGIKYNF